MLASVWAVTAGFLTMAVLVMAGSVVLMRIYAPGAMQAMRSGQAPLPPPSPGYIVRNIILSLAAAVAGGAVTLRLAPSAPTGHLAALGLVVLAMGLVSAKSPGSAHQPAWYRVAIPFVGLTGVVLAGLIG